MLAHIRDVVAATTLPVNADFLAGYADDPEGVAANVALVRRDGSRGISIEDGTGNDAAPLYEARHGGRAHPGRPPRDRRLGLTGGPHGAMRGLARRRCRTRSAWRRGGSPRTPRRAPIVSTLPASPEPGEIAALVKAVARSRSTS
mgnify:CR=1 FL=1